MHPQSTEEVIMTYKKEPKRPETSKTLMEKLKAYQFPQCTKEEVHETLNIMCVDPHCPPEKQLDAFCARCSDLNLHKKPTHLQMSIRNTLKDLLRQCPDVHDDPKALQEDEIEKEYKKTAKAYKLLSQQCQQIADNLETSLEKYSKARAQSPEQFIVRKIISSIVSNSGSEKALRSYLKELHEYVLITEKGLVVNDSLSAQLKEQIILSSKNYIDYHKEVKKKVLSYSVEKLLSMGVIQDYNKLQRKKQTAGGQVDQRNVIKKDFTVPAPMCSINTSLQQVEDVNQSRKRSSSKRSSNANLCPIDHNKYKLNNEALNRSNSFHKPFHNEVNTGANTDITHGYQSYSQAPSNVIQNAVNVSSKSNIQQHQIVQLDNQIRWEALVTDSNRGWNQNDLHGPWDCGVCCDILQKSIQEIDVLDRQRQALGQIY